MKKDAIRRLMEEALNVAINDHLGNEFIDEWNQANGSPVEIEIHDIDDSEIMVRVKHLGPTRYFAIKLREVL